MTKLEELANAAADKAHLSVKDTAAKNAYRLLAWMILEVGSPKLPHKTMGILVDVLRKRAGLTVTTGSLRWYKATMLRDPEMVDRMVSLPAAYKDLLVRTGQAA